MKLTFRSQTSSLNLVVDTTAETYSYFSGFGSNGIMVKSNKELHQLELMLIKGGYKEVWNTYF